MTRRVRKSGTRPTTLWGKGESLDPAVFEYTAGVDREQDAQLLRWDVLGSLGHLDALAASKLIAPKDRATLRGALRAILREVDRGALALGREHEDAHTAVELWLGTRVGAAAGRLHTGRSRNDQVVCDLRLFLKSKLLALHEDAAAFAEALLAFAARHRDLLWPGYTHTRRAMPSSAGAWSAGFADGVLDTLEALPEIWRRLDRSPLGTAAGYGAPLDYQREMAAHALGFAAVDPCVTGVQGGRGRLEAAVLFWCCELAHDAAKLASDAILFSSDEYGWLVLPPELATGSSLMPHKRNPDLLELTRARAARLESDLDAVLRLKSKLTSGYHRDFQALKEPLMGGLERARTILGAATLAIGRLQVDRERARAAIGPDLVATDVALGRAEAGEPFREAYRAVAAELLAGVLPSIPSDREILARRRGTGGLGNLGLVALNRRARATRRWAASERRRFARALERLAGTES